MLATVLMASVELVTQVVAAEVEAETSASALCPTLAAAYFRLLVGQAEHLSLQVLLVQQAVLVLLSLWCSHDDTEMAHL